MKKWLVVVLSIVMLITSAVPISATKYENVIDASNMLASESVKTDALARLEAQANDLVRDDEVMPAVVELNESYFSQLGEPVSIELLKTQEGKQRQSEFGQKVLSAINDEMLMKYHDFKRMYDLDLLMIGFTGEAPYRVLKELAKEPWVKTVELSPEFNAPKNEMPLYMQPRMATSNLMVEANKIHSKYKGEGMVIAVLDSGADMDHPAFYISKEAKDTIKIKSEDELNKLKGDAPGKWHNDKIPYYYNYVDKDYNVKDTNEDTGMHGQHVAGTVLGNKYTLFDGKEFIGIAPEAQLLVMRVFGEYKATTHPTYYVPAIEDAIKLGACSVNMSLGSPAGNVTFADSSVNAALKKAADIGCVVAIAGGNESQFGYGVGNPDAHNPDYGVVGSPSVATLGLSVASMENTHMREKQISLLVDGKVKGAYSYKAAGESRFDYEKEYEYVDAKLGRVVDASQNIFVNDFEDIDVNGKVALIERGDISFTEKINNAAAHGAIGVICYNHEAGGDAVILMKISGTRIPAISIGHSQGLELIEQIENGKVKVGNDDILVNNPNSGKISDFSNWGLSAQATLKPEILAPGGRIYSTMNDRKFDDMSGTSMATPHVAGGIAIVRQRVNEEFSSLTDYQKHEMVKALLMSTAEPHVNRNGVISSPRNQGAGIMKLEAAVNTPAVVLSEKEYYSGKSLGDVGESFEFTVRVKNLTDKALKYSYYTNVTTDEVKDGRFTLNPQFLYKTEPTEITVAANGETTVDVKVDVTDHAEKLKESMPNGYFIEGFVIFESDSAVKISYPFVGFKGSWEKLDVIEPSIYDLVKDGRLPFYYDNTGEKRDYTHFSSLIDEKTVIAGAVDDFDYKKPEFKLPLVISPNDDNKLDSIYFTATFLRNYEDFAMYLYNNVDGKPSNNYIKKLSGYYSYNSSGIKNHHSANPKWAKSVTDRSWKFDGYRIDDGKYFIGTSVKAVAATGTTYKPQNTYYEVIVDTIAPKATSANVTEDKVLTLTILEEGSGIKVEKVTYRGSVIDKEENGTYKLPEDADLSQVFVELEDYGYNKSRASVESILNYDPEAPGDGTVTVVFEDEDGESVEGAEYVIKNSLGKIVENGKLNIGEYTVEVTKVPDKYSLSKKTQKVKITESNKEVEVTFILSPESDPDAKYNISLRFKVNYEERVFVEGEDYTVDGIYVRDYTAPGGYRKVADSLSEGVVNGLYYVKVNWLNSKYEVNAYLSNEYFSALIRGADYTVDINLKKKPVSTSGKGSVEVIVMTEEGKKFVEDTDYTVKITDTKGNPVEDRNNVDNGFYIVSISLTNEKLKFADSEEGETPDKKMAYVSSSLKDVDVIFNVEERAIVKELSAKKVETPKLTVDFGTEKKDLELPKTVKLTAEVVETILNIDAEVGTSIEYDVKAAWDLENTDYDAETAGEYTIDGTLDEESLKKLNIKGADELDVECKVTVLEKVVVIDKTELKKAIDDALEFEESKYVASTYAELVRALKKGQTVYVDDGASQDDVNTAVKEIRAAIRGLKKKIVVKPVEHEVSPIEVPKDVVFNIPNNNPIIETPVVTVPVAEPKANEFADVQGHWGKAAIDYVVEKGLFDGISRDKFAPDSASTRGEIIVALYKSAQSPVMNNEINFTDVDETKLYYNAVRWAVQNNIIAGYADGTFKANKAVTRQELARILCEFMKYQKLELPKTNVNLKDMDKVSDWAKSYVSEIVSINIMQGYADGSFHAEDTVTRAQIAQVVKNILDR